MKHHWLHIAGCVLPLLLVFVLPLFGLGSGITLFAFIALMFVCHLTMHMGHGHSPNHADHGDAAAGHDHHHLQRGREVRDV